MTDEEYRAFYAAAFPRLVGQVVARRLAVSRWRSAWSALKAWRRHGPMPDTPPPSVDNPLIVAALQQLPEEQRRAIVLYHLCDLSVDEVAAETGVPAGTVKARLSRGRAALRRILGEPDPRYSIIGADSVTTWERRHA